MSMYIGVDVGGTNIVCGLTDKEGRLIGKKKLPTEAHKGSDYVISKISGMIKELMKEMDKGLEAINAVGVGTPGFVDPVQGICISASNLHWSNVPLAQKLSDQIHTPVFINNDVKMYVYGEAISGAGRGFDHVLGITIGTGIASAMVNEGNLYYGGGFLAGEMGHIRMEGVQTVCNCGMTGCLETICSATGIARQAREAIENGTESILQQWVDDCSQITAEDVSKAYDVNDALAVRVMQYTGTMLGKGLSYAVPLLSPDVIIIGGGGALAGERLFAPIRKELKRLILPMYWDRLQIKPAKWLDDAGIIGSAMQAKFIFENENPK